MKFTFSKSAKTIFFLVLLLAFLSFVNTFLPQGSFISQLKYPVPIFTLAIINFFTVFIFYGIFSFLALVFAKKLNLAELWNEKITNKQRFILPIVIGLILGFTFMLFDLLFNKIHGLNLPHPPFPTSLVVSLIAGIGEELIFRFFLISFFVWIFYYIIFRKKYETQIFWIVAIIVAIFFSFAHIPSLTMHMKILPSEIPISLHLEMLLINVTLSLFATYYWKKYGFLTAIGIHFWTDIIWHALYGGVFS